MIKKIQFFIICLLAIVLFFVILDRNNFLSTNTVENEQLISQIVEEHLAMEQDPIEGEREHLDEEQKSTDVEEHNDEMNVVEENIEETRKTVYLTFDDGPTNATAAILDTLDLYNAKATFFMLEPAMRSYPDLVNRTAREGHAVALHGVTHVTEKFYQSEQTALNEMKIAQETLETISGVHSHLVRTPYGSIPYLTDSFRNVLAENGFILWDWNVDSSDWNLSKDKFVQNVISQIEKVDAEGGTPVILFHDRSETSEHLSNLLIYLQDNNFRTEVIDEHTEPVHFNCYDRCYRFGH